MRRLHGALLILCGITLVLGCSVEGRAATLGVPGIDSHPRSFSADGLELYFWSGCCPYHLFSVPRAGGEPTQRDERNLSPDGSTFAVLECTFVNAGCNVALVDAVSGVVKQASIGPPAYWVVWSPDGRWLAFEGPGSNGSDVITLYNMPSRTMHAAVDVNRVRSIVWSPDSSRIAFDTDNVAADAEEDDPHGMYVLPTNGLPREMPDAARPVSWSRDGRRLAYYRSGLFSVKANGTGVRKMFPAHDDVVLSDDWRWVAFSDQSLYGSDIYVQQLGHAPRRITPSQCTAAPAPCLQGTDHHDRFVGGPTRDVYLAGAGDDDVLGGGGNDLLEGGPGKDRLVGGTGKNTLHGGWGGDVLSGGPEADSLYGDQGHDRIYGGGGNDFIYVRDSDRDFVDCGPGVDRVIADPDDVVRNCERVDRRG